jgi:hypothetical protein
MAGNDRHKRYQKARAALIDKALKYTREYLNSLGLSTEEERKDMFNRVFLHQMDELSYEAGLISFKPPMMSHERENLSRHGATR